MAYGQLKRLSPHVYIFTREITKHRKRPFLSCNISEQIIKPFVQSIVKGFKTIFLLKLIFFLKKRTILVIETVISN